MRRISAPSPRLWAGIAVGTALMLSCAAPSYTSNREVSAPPALSTASILAPVADDGYAELGRLRDAAPSPATALRRAFVLLSTGSHNRAITELNRLMFAEPPPTRDVQAFAHYLRALAYDHKHDHERRDHDLAMATELAADSALVARIDASRTVTPTAPPEAGPAPTAILPRSAWHAANADARHMDPMTPINRLTIHHSGMPAPGRSLAAAGDHVRRIQNGHIKDRGWADIGYHFLIDPSGRVWTGRAIQWQGAHAGDGIKNRGNVGICLLGNFVHGGDANPPAAQLQSMTTLVESLCRRYHIRPDHVYTHKELKSSTDCPGPLLQSIVERMRQGLLARGVGQAGSGTPTE